MASQSTTSSIYSVSLFDMLEIRILLLLYTTSFDSIISPQTLRLIILDRVRRAVLWNTPASVYWQASNLIVVALHFSLIRYGPRIKRKRKIVSKITL